MKHVELSQMSDRLCVFMTIQSDLSSTEVTIYLDASIVYCFHLKLDILRNARMFTRLVTHVKRVILICETRMCA